MNRPIVAISWGRGMFLAFVLVIAALGFCVFDGGDHHSPGSGSSPDLCLSVLTVSFASTLLAGLLSDSWAIDDRPAIILSAWVRVPAPPPRSS